ncbi:MAG: glycosyltransferase [Deltaproteobacteria bacterium]|jgi:glycosyltransferase involved in cell wall biosynthesis|nr:glycosyltransferase [Deltaproteobacteria bacterium]
MRICYLHSDYVSYRVAALANMECLRLLGHEVADDARFLSGADLAVVHGDPVMFTALLGRCPGLRDMRVIAYCVWEGDKLPRIFADSLGQASEIWTCSHYSQRAFQEYFPRTAVVPHVVRRRPLAQALLDEARERVGGVAPDDFLFFSIVDAINPRKNIRDLLFAFSRVRERCARKVRLILKQYRVEMDFSSLEGVCGIGGELEDAQIAALHAISHAYVSAHHAEGWGLGLSEAMAFGKPVIATGYSGNMEFMNERNSLPVPYILGPVSEEMFLRLPWFSPGMLWADIDKEALIRAMERVAMGRCDPGICLRAAEITRTFSPGAVAETMRALL